MTTSAPGSITTSSAVLGGNVTADGGATVTERGVVYSPANTSPTIGGTNTTTAPNGSGTGSYSASISGLSPGSAYYVRAYATNSVGTSYGGVQTFTTAQATATVTAVAGQTPSPTATPQVTYIVTFSAPVSGVTASNLSLATTGLSGAGIASVSPTTGTSATYTVVVNTGIGDGTLQLNVANATGITPTLANVPYTSGTTYTITKSFAAAPTLRIQGAGSASGNSDVTAFVDVVQVLSGGSAFANGVQNGSFETNNAASGNYLYQSQGVVAAPWSFGTQSGISRNNSAFGSTAADGDAVAFLQSAAGNNGYVSQNLAVPMGSYQVRFRALQRNYTSLDQRLNVFVNDVFVGRIQPNNIPTYDTFTSAAFSVTAPALTATVSTTSASPTSTAPIPYSVSFSQSVGSTFTASDVTVAGGTLTSGSFSGSGSGPYSFTVTPSGVGTVTVSLAAGVASDANNTQNTASNAVSVQFQPPTLTVAPTALPGGTQGTAYSVTFSVSGGAGPYSYAITAGVLPAGLTLTSTGVLSGTPTISGSFNFTVTATDNSAAPGPYSSSRSYTLVIAAPPVTAAPVLTAPANGSILSTTTPTYTGTAPAGSSVTVYVDGAALSGPVTANASGSWNKTQPTALSQGSHTVYATATDAAGNTSPNSATTTFTVDTTPLSVSINSAAGASGSSTSTTPIPFAVSFSKSVTGFVQGDLSVTGGTVAGFSGSGTTYSFSVTPASSGSTVTVNVAAGVAQDAAGNSNTAATPFSLTYQQAVVATSRAVTVQLAANGTATLQASDVNNGSTGSGTLTYTIQKIAFGRVPENSTLTLSTPSGASFTAIRFASFGTPSDDGNGNYRMGSCNAAGQPGTANSVAKAQNAYVGQSSGSLLASNNYSDGSTNFGDPCSGTPKYLAVQAAYSTDAASQSYACVEAGKTQYVLLTVTDGSGNTSTATAKVTVVAPPAISVSSISPGTAPRGATVTVAGANLGGIGSTVTVNGASATVSSLTANGFTFVVPTSATIGAGNLTLTAPCSQTLNTPFTVQQAQTAAPALSVAGNIPNGQPTFSGTAPAGSALVITIAQGSTTSRTITGITAAADGSYSYTVPPGSNLVPGSYTASATAQSSGSSVSASSAQIAFTVTATGPATVLSSTASNPTTASPIPVTVTFSRNVTGFSASSVAVSNSGGTATVSSFTAVDGKTYTFSVVPSATGLIAVSVPAGAAQDSLSRSNQAAAQLTRQYNQPATAAPVITTPANNSALSTTTPTFSGTAPASSTVTVYVDGGSSGTTTAAVNGTFTFTQSTALSQGSHTVYATAQTSGAAVSPNSATNTFTVDTVSPSVAISSSAGASGGSTGTSPIPFTVTFSESVMGFGQGDLTVTGGSITSFAGSGSTYSFSVTPASIGSVVTVNVAASVAQDQAGNGNAAAPAAYSLRYTPALTATVSTSSGSPTSTSPIPFSVSFSQSVGSTFTASDVTVAGGTLTSGSFSGSGSGPYSFTVRPSAAGTVTVSLAAGVAQDAANTGNQASNAVSVQFQAPTIAVAPAALPGGTQGTAYSTTFSASGGAGPYTYAASGTLPPGLTLTSTGTLSGTPTAAGTYSFHLTATDNSAAPGPYSGYRDYTLAIAAPVVMTVSWTGTVSTDWFTAANWSPAQVPDVTIDATIPTAPSGNRFPFLTSGTASARNLSIGSGATLVQTGGTLTLAANLTNNGAYQPTGGTLALGGSTRSNLLGSSDTRLWNLTVGASGAQSSTSASTSVQQVLTLNGNFATNGNPFTLESSGSGTALVVNNGSNVVTGNVTVQRYLSPALNSGLGYHHYAAPISTATVASLATASYAPVVNPAYNTSATPARERPFPTVLGYDQARLASTSNDLDLFTKGWYSPASTADALAVGQGYALNLSAGQALAVRGPLNNGDLTVALARNSGATAADAGLALVGNPYPAPLDWSQVASGDRPGLDGVLYVFQSTSQYGGQYRSYVNGVGGDPVVAQGQGFFVRVTPGQTSGALTFRNSQRLTTYQNPAVYRSAETRPLVQLRLQGSATPYQDDATVYFQAGATAGLDAEFDAPKLANSTGLNLSTSLPARQQLSIDGRPAPLGTTQLVVPLAVGVPTPGSYSLTAAQLLNLRTTPTYLRDLQTGAVVDLAQQPSYQFTVGNASSLLTGRFELVFSPQQALAANPAALAQQVALYPNPTAGTAYVELPASLGRQAVSAVLVDAVGRQVRALTLPAQGAVAHLLDLHELPTGVYTLHLRTSAGTLVKRLTVE